MARRITLSLVAVAALIAACSRAPTPQPTPAPAPRPLPRPTPTPAPPPASSDWRDWPLTPGTWTYRADTRGSVAMYGTPGADAVLVLRCDRGAGAMLLSRAGSSSTALTVRTSTTARTLAARPSGGLPAYVVATLTPLDNLLDAMGFSRGRFIVETAGQAPLVVPAWPEILRVTEDCRG